LIVDLNLRMETKQPQGPAANVDALSTREGYDRWAAIYDDEDNPLIVMEEPQVARLLGEVGGLTVADIGCGTGRHAIPLARAGAHVTAVDFSDGMLDKGRAKAQGLAIRWVRQDLADVLPLENARFDRVICCLVLEHIVDLEHLFRELKRICRPDGFIVVSAMHPAMMLRGISARFTDPGTGRETRPQSHPNQIADYVMGAVRAGLAFDHISEHAVNEEIAARSPRSQKYLGWPMLLMMRLQVARQPDRA
jgi:malonyl-CoA O-methyltransferase